ncbi:hypothetical protein B0T26DRAFT_640323, partial [Lasiosphaeria miniovina]
QLDQILQPEAADRLGRIRLVKEQRATEVESRLIMLAQSVMIDASVHTRCWGAYPMLGTEVSTDCTLGMLRQRQCLYRGGRHGSQGPSGESRILDSLFISAQIYDYAMLTNPNLLFPSLL